MQRLGREGVHCGWGGEVGSGSSGRMWYSVEGTWVMDEVQPGATGWVADSSQHNWEHSLSWLVGSQSKFFVEGENQDWGKVCSGRLHGASSWGWSFGQGLMRGALSQVLEQLQQGWEVVVAEGGELGSMVKAEVGES